MVASNKTLTELTNCLPDTPERLLQISGFGEAKVNAFGDEFLRIIRDYISEHDLVIDREQSSPGKEKKQKKQKEANEDTTKKVNTKEQTLAFYRQGISVEEIARQRGMTVGTIQTHLIPYITTGEVLVDDLVSKEKQKLILKALEKFNYEEGLNPIKNNLPSDISFSEIRFVMAHRLKD
jgi:uncharacterized protein YpbB